MPRAPSCRRRRTSGESSRPRRTPSSRAPSGWNAAACSSARPAPCWAARWPPAPRWTSSGPCGCRRRSRPSWWRGCSTASTGPGSPSRGEQLARDELMLLAEAWLDEAHDAAAREQELRGELAVLGDERAAALAAMEAEAARAAADGPSPEEDRQARVNAARAAVAAADERQRPHLEAEALVASVAAELAAAAEAERLAAEEASDAEAAVAEATEPGRAAQCRRRPDRRGAGGARPRPRSR